MLCLSLRDVLMGRLLKLLIHSQACPQCVWSSSRHVAAFEGVPKAKEDPVPWRHKEEALLVAKLHEISEAKFPSLPQEWQLYLAEL
jgi:hypothetical protein